MNLTRMFLPKTNALVKSALSNQYFNLWQELRRTHIDSNSVDYEHNQNSRFMQTIQEYTHDTQTDIKSFVNKIIPTTETLIANYKAHIFDDMSSGLSILSAINYFEPFLIYSQ